MITLFRGIAAIWLFIALGLVAYTYSGAQDAMVVGSLYLTVWTFPIGPICFLWREGGFPWLSTTQSFLFENLLIVTMTFLFWFVVLPMIRTKKK